MSFDSPFLFLLTDTQTRSPLFVAVVNDPSA
ncbi:serpin family protein [Blastococcus colisei]|nr:serpin family protein [Blastococcus colisei]